ncbi:MAG: septal ring lytic transglycosylase RlpA family protein [Pseudomonadota bacterium]
MVKRLAGKEAKSLTTVLKIAVLPIALAACSNSSDNSVMRPSAEVGHADIMIDDVPIPTVSDETKFASKDYGVGGSPRVTDSKQVRKGGGAYKVGKPYTIRGKRYVPREDPNYDKKGLASWYGPNFHGRLTANGEIYDQYSLSAAHPTMPLPSYAKVTNLENGASVTVRVNDRGPYAHNRIIDLSAQAARLLGYTKKGVAKVRVEYVGRARMDGLDGEKLMASYDPGNLDPSLIPHNRGRKVLLAKIGEKLGITSSSNRTTLQSFGPTGFDAPVPEFRPLTNNGYPVLLSSNAPRQPLSLLNGFAEDHGQQVSAGQQIENILGAGNVPLDTRQSRYELRQIVLGPYSNGNVLSQVETMMLDWGPTMVEFDENRQSAKVRAMVATESVSDLLKLLKKEKISKFQLIN